MLSSTCNRDIVLSMLVSSIILTLKLRIVLTFQGFFTTARRWEPLVLVSAPRNHDIDRLGFDLRPLLSWVLGSSA
jgi:hypothetical protein